MIVDAGDQFTKNDRPDGPREPWHEHADYLALSKCEDWQEARGQQMAEWARCAKADRWGTGHAELSLDALSRMGHAEVDLSDIRPKTMAGACRMLEVAIEILAYANINPEHVFAQGPVLEIMRNVNRALEVVSPNLLLKNEPPAG